MRLPIDTSSIKILALGPAAPINEYGTTNQRTDLSGVPLYKVPVVLSGTTDRIDPTTTITIASASTPLLTNGDVLTAVGLTISSWTMRDGSGQDRSGVTLRAESLTPSAKPQR